MPAYAQPEDPFSRNGGRLEHRGRDSHRVLLPPHVALLSHQRWDESRPRRRETLPATFSLLPRSTSTSRNRPSTADPIQNHRHSIGSAPLRPPFAARRASMSPAGTRRLQSMVSSPQVDSYLRPAVADQLSSLIQDSSLQFDRSLTSSEAFSNISGMAETIAERTSNEVFHTLESILHHPSPPDDTSSEETRSQAAANAMVAIIRRPSVVIEESLSLSHHIAASSPTTDAQWLEDGSSDDDVEHFILDESPPYSPQPDTANLTMPTLTDDGIVRNGTARDDASETGDMQHILADESMPANFPATSVDLSDDAPSDVALSIVDANIVDESFPANFPGLRVECAEYYLQDDTEMTLGVRSVSSDAERSRLARDRQHSGLGISLPALPRELLEGEDWASEEEQSEGPSAGFVEILRHQDLVQRRSITEPTLGGIHPGRAGERQRQASARRAPSQKQQGPVDPYAVILSMLPQSVADEVRSQTESLASSVQMSEPPPMPLHQLTVLLAGAAMHSRAKEKLALGLTRALCQDFPVQAANNDGGNPQAQSEFIALKNPLRFDGFDVWERSDTPTVRLVPHEEGETAIVADICVYNFTTLTAEQDIAIAAALAKRHPIYPIFQESSSAKGLALRYKVRSGLIAHGVETREFVFIPGTEPAVFQLAIMDPRVLRKYLLLASQRSAELLREKQRITSMKMWLRYFAAAALLCLLSLAAMVEVEKMSMADWREAAIGQWLPWRSSDWRAHRAKQGAYYFSYAGSGRSHLFQDSDDVESMPYEEPTTDYDLPKPDLLTRLKGFGSKVASRTFYMVRRRLGQDKHGSRRHWLRPLLLSRLPGEMVGLLEDGRSGTGPRYAWFESGTALALTVEGAINVVLDATEAMSEAAMMVAYGAYVAVDEVFVLTAAAWEEFEESPVGEEVLSFADWMRERAAYAVALTKKRWQRLTSQTSV